MKTKTKPSKSKPAKSKPGVKKQVVVYFEYIGERVSPVPTPNRLYIQGPSLAACRRFAKNMGMEISRKAGMQRLWKMAPRTDDTPGIAIGADGQPLGPCVSVVGGVAEVVSGDVDIIDFDNLQG